MGFKSQLCLAQAQECILEKSILDNRKPLIISKVPYWIRIRLPLKLTVIFPEKKFIFCDRFVNDTHKPYLI
jgi:hypothetical protein